jgi:hypothetical protein
MQLVNLVSLMDTNVSTYYQMKPYQLFKCFFS